MPINAQIPLGVQPVQIQQPDPNSGMNALAKVMQIRGLQQDNQLGQLKMDEYQRGVEDQNYLRSALAVPDADPYKVLLQRGKVKEATEFAKGQADIAKNKTETESKAVETAHKRLDTWGQSMGWLRQNPSPENASAVMQHLVTLGVMPAEMAQGAMASLQANPTPQAVAQFADMGFRSALQAKDQLQKFQTNNIGGQTVTQGIDPVTGKATLVNALQNTQSPDNAASVAATMRGQNLTDSRARDFNATQVDANNIKRAEKKETADLTKNSQVASFDTMLGTLDRLSNHPGLSRSVGRMGALPTMPGSDSANFQAELNTFQSQAFLPMVAQLKGMGALSDAEGKKLTAAVGALDPKMGEQAFRDSISRITNDMEAARQRVSGQPTAPRAAAPAGGRKAPAVGTVQAGYRFKGGDPADQKSWEKQ